MRPIRDIAAVGPSSVLYHSAFGFARVEDVDPHQVTLEWEGSGQNLPARVSTEVLQRVYALCARDGFFHRAVNDSEGLRSLLMNQPLDALRLLLTDLHGPQRKQDVRDWIVGRRLLSPDAFGHWWEALRPVLQEDDSFRAEGDSLSLRSAGDVEGPAARLQNPLLAPGRRLDLALAHRKELDDDVFVANVLLAWRTGGTQVRELALAALRDRDASVVLGGLLAAGPDAIEALIHAIRRASWRPEDVGPEFHERLIQRVLQGTEEGGPLDNEGRLAATLTRWPSPGAVDALADIAGSTDGKRLLRATFAALPPRRGEALSLQLLEAAIADQDPDTAQWLGGEALGFALVDHEEMAERLEDDHPELARWYHDEFQGVEAKPVIPEYDDSTDDNPQTAEIDLSDVVSQPIPIGQLPPRSGASLLGLGLAISRALTIHHKDGRVANPTSTTVRVLPDETMEIEAIGPTAACPRPLMEPPSPTTDVYAGAVLLLEALLGRPWPRNIPASRAIPYLRMVIPLLPPAAVAPLDAALHPDGPARPRNGLEWLALWQAAAVAEENRNYAARNHGARLQIGYDSHIGRMKVLLTQTNQDSVFVSTKGALSLLVVCDGISTANAGSGDVASSIASHVIANLWEQALPRLVQAGPSEIRDFLDRALRMANTAVCEAALRFAGGDLDGRVPMGTTATVAIAQGNWMSLAWLGDSRAYLVGPYGASLLTADENQAGERLKAWHLNFIDGWDPAGFALVGYLGHFNELARPEALSAHHLAFTLMPSERLMISSDGITDYVGETHPEVSQVVRSSTAHAEPEEAARQLVTLANRGGGGDNCTAVVATLWQP